MKKIALNRGVYSVYLAAIVGIIITASLVFIAYGNSYDHAKGRSNSQIFVIKDDVTRKINSVDEVIHGMRTLFDASNQVEADEFRLLSGNILTRHPYMESSTYLKKVTSNQRNAFEEEMQYNGFINFSITENINGNLVPSRINNEYFSAIYREPFTPRGAKYLGLDYLSIDGFSASIEDAIDSAKARTSVHVSGKNYVVFIAVYAGKSTPKTVVERRRTVVGIIALHIDATKLVGSHSKYEIALTLDQGEHKPSQLLFYSSIDEEKLNDYWVVNYLESKHRFNSGEETFQLTMKTPLMWYEMDATFIAGSAILGLLITLLIVLQAQSIINRNRSLYARNTQIKELVNERTEELAVEKERATTTLESIADAVITLDDQGAVTYLNPIAESITGWAHGEALGLPVHDVLTARNETTHSPLDYRLIYKSIECAEVVKITDHVIVINQENGHETSVEISTAPITSVGGEINGAVVVSHDVSNARQLAQDMTYLATHDDLTALPNRALLLDRLVQAISRGQWNDKSLAVLFLDLDRFKLVNDTYGHDVGDELLRHVAKRLVSCLRSGDTVSRLGGDEFVIVLRDLAEPEDVHSIAKKIIAAFNLPFQLAGEEFYTTFSIGVCLYPKDSDSALELMKKADIAMYRAKESGKNNYVLYDDEMSKSDACEINLETDLRRAIEREEFELYYQPQVDSVSGEVIGVEALIRWNRPKYGLISPLEFIPIAEETGLIIPIGQWALRKAAEQCKQWHNFGLSKVQVSVNISAVQFQQGSIFNDVKRILEETKLEPKYFGLELTEGTLVQDPKAAINTLNQLKKMGVKLSIDDFGTGYSSLSYLKQFCVSTLKIDRCFVKDVLTDKDDAAMCSAIISIAHNLNLNVIAEGVETIEQLEFLKKNNCNTIQGYLFSKPLSNDDFIKYLSMQKKPIYFIK